MTPAQRRLLFISGLPRSGSTLLAAILRQNPRFRAGISSLLADIFGVTLRAMSMSEGAQFVNEEQRRAVLSAVFEAYYLHEPEGVVVFDTNRAWCSLTAAISQLLPTSRVVCCVRSPAWILDSVERLIQRNALHAPRTVGADRGNVFERCGAMTAPNGFLSAPLSGLKQAWVGECADRVIAVRYNSLCENTCRVLAEIYDLVEEEPFQRDFDNFEYEEPEFDSRLGMPGLHRVDGPVSVRTRRTILPREIFAQYDREFWNAPDQNPRGVRVL